MLSNKEIAINYTHSIWNDKAIEVLDNYLHPDIIIHSLLGFYTGPKAMKTVINNWLVGFPDLQVIQDHVICDNDMVSIQWRAVGTHMGEFKGKEPTRKKVTYSGASVYKIKNSKIVEYWAYVDMNHLLSQIS